MNGAEMATIEQTLDLARSALRDAPPVGDDAYLRFASAACRALNRDWPRIEQANATYVRLGRERGLSEPLLHRIGITATHRDRLLALADAMPALRCGA